MHCKPRLSVKPTQSPAGWCAVGSVVKAKLKHRPPEEHTPHLRHSPGNSHPTCAGPQLDLPHDATPKQLETLLNGLLQQKEKLPYSFFIEEQPLSEDLGVHLHKHKVAASTGCGAFLLAGVALLL